MEPYGKLRCRRTHDLTKQYWSIHQHWAYFSPLLLAVVIGALAKKFWHKPQTLISVDSAIFALLCGVVAYLVAFGGSWLINYIWLAPAAVHQEEQDKIEERARKIQALQEEVSTPEQIVRDKVADALRASSLDGIRLIRYVHKSYTEYEPNLIEKFGVATLEDAERSTLLEKRQVRMSGTNDDLLLYSIRDEYRSILDDVLGSA